MYAVITISFKYAPDKPSVLSTTPFSLILTSKSERYFKNNRYYQNKFYILSDLRKNLSQVNPKSGKAEWTTELPGKYKWRSSPTAGDGKIYLMNHNGMVLVVSAASGKILHSAEFGDTYDDNTRSSIAISAGNLFIRTNEKLYCIKN